METKKLITFANLETKEGERHFEVPCDWLDKVLEDWALADYETDSHEEGSSKDAYIRFRKESLYDNLSDKYFTSDILSFAIEDGIV